MRKHQAVDLIPAFETRYVPRLESLLGSIELSAKKGYIESTVLNISAHYFNRFVRGQAFLNGNKRSGVLFTHLFLLVHNVEYTLTNEEMFSFAAVVAKAGELGADLERTHKFCVAIINRYTKEETTPL